MGNSEVQKKIINLGKQFVKELELEPGVDTISRWMAHYLADKMIAAENSSGKKKKLAEEECFNTILKLWKHRWNLPSGKQPYEDFKPILDTLHKIGLKSVESPFIYSTVGIKKQPEITKVDLNNIEGADWLIIANQIDRTSRVWLSHSLKQYAISVKKDNIDEWLNNTVGSPDDEDSTIIRIVLDKGDDINDEEFNKKIQKEKLEQRIVELEKFGIINSLLLKDFQKELSKI